MSSHFTSIGFPINSPEDFKTFGVKVEHSGEKIKARKCFYVRLSDSSGAQLYLQLNRWGQKVDLNPHFRGQGSIKIKIEKTVESGGRELPSAFMGWLIDPPESDDPSAELCPMVFNVPDFLTLKKKRFPFISDVQMSAFAHEITLYKDEKDYEANRKDFAIESFMPAGFNTPDGKKRVPPTAHAIFSGRILESEKKTNEITNQDYYWLLVKSIGGQYDVVCDLSLISKKPAVGSLISGAFWLSGQLEKQIKKKE